MKGCERASLTWIGIAGENEFTSRSAEVGRTRAVALELAGRLVTRAAVLARTGLAEGHACATKWIRVGGRTRA